MNMIKLLTHLALKIFN